MISKCPLCGKEIEVSEELQEGQHVLCPYCNQKFAFGRNSEQRKPTRVSVPQRKAQSKGARCAWLAWCYFKCLVGGVLWLVWLVNLFDAFSYGTVDNVIKALMSIRVILIFFVAVWFSKNCVCGGGERIVDR